MLKSIKLSNLLSFGAETEIVFNKGLNVLIGSNGSGKSNLIEAISLLQAMPKDLTKVIRDGGGIEEWLWKGEKNSVAQIKVLIENPYDLEEVEPNVYECREPIEHILKFNAVNRSLKIVGEFIREMYGDEFTWYYRNNFNDEAVFNSGMQLEHTSINIKTNQSILAQRQDPDNYPEITHVSGIYQRIRIYREWQFGRNNLTRQLQRADLPNDFLDENSSNLGLILSSFGLNSEIKKKLIDALKLFSESIEGFEVIPFAGYVQIFLVENGFIIPATRISDGTLRYLSLLAILLHPNPPPLICIEEPELGLHPDVLPSLIELLKEAGERTQIIITTHSADLIDELSDMPEAVMVFDKHDGSTTVNRLNKDELGEWLVDYRLGELWNRGHIGGNRW